MPEPEQPEGHTVGTATIRHVGRGTPLGRPIDPDDPVDRANRAEAALADVMAERDRLWQAADVLVSVLDDALNQGETWPHIAAYDEEAECRVTTRTMTELSWEELGEYTEELRRALTTTKGEGAATGAWEAEEAEADADIAAGRTKRFDNAADVIAWLDDGDDPDA